MSDEPKFSPINEKVIKRKMAKAHLEGLTEAMEICDKLVDTGDNDEAVGAGSCAQLIRERIEAIRGG